MSEASENSAAESAPNVEVVQQQPAGGEPPVPASTVVEPSAGPAPRVRGPSGRFIKGGRDAYVQKAGAIAAAAVAEATRADVENKSAESVIDVVDYSGNYSTETEEVPTPGEQSPPPDPVAESSEGPSENLLMVAKALGVPDYVVEMAKSDDALRIAIAMNNPGPAEGGGGESIPPQRQVLPQQRQEQEADSLVPEDFRVKLLLPADYSDPEDPMFQQQQHLVDRISELQELVAHLATQQVQINNERQSSAEAAAIQRYDAALDATDWEIVGKRAEMKSAKDTEFLARQKMFPAYERLAQALPQLPAERLIELAYEQVFGKRPAPKKSPNEAARLAALQRSNGRILGSGSGGPPAAEPKLSKKDQFLRRIQEIQAGRS